MVNSHLTYWERAMGAPPDAESPKELDFENAGHWEPEKAKFWEHQTPKKMDFGHAGHWERQESRILSTQDGKSRRECWMVPR
jgi:hypothetical protein